MNAGEAAAAKTAAPYVVGVAVIAAAAYWTLKSGIIPDVLGDAEKALSDIYTGTATMEERQQIGENNIRLTQIAFAAGLDTVKIIQPWNDKEVEALTYDVEAYEEAKAEAETWMATSQDDAGITAAYGSDEYNKWAVAHPEQAYEDIGILDRTLKENVDSFKSILSGLW